MVNGSSYDPQALKAFEQVGWERVSATYHDTFANLTRLTADALPFAVGAGARLLEVARGTGNVGANATGVDFIAGMVSEARKL